MHAISTRRILTLILVGALVLSAGCSGIGIGGSDTDTTETGDAPATEDSPERGDETPTTDDASDESEAATDDSDADGTETGDGHDHDHGNATDSPAAGDVGELNSSSAESWGWATIVVDGQKLDLSERDESGDAVGVGGEKFIWLSATEGLTLADALSYFGVDADSSQVTVDGEQYSAADEGTSITYRVNGDPVDPEQYELGTRDEIWMVVETADTDVDVPGEYISIDEPHAHGPMTFEVDGHEVDFSRDKYQTNHDHFHFEGNHGETWHAHSWSVTLEFALSSLADIDVEGDTVTYNGTTYDPSDEGTSVEMTVNGESVEPSEYLLKDGDSVEVVIETEG